MKPICKIGLSLFTLMMPTPLVAADYAVEEIAGGLEHPWAVEPMPDGRFLVTERPGRLRIISAEGALSAPLRNLPKVSDTGQGGLLDLALDPDFENNRLIYFSYAEPDGEKSGTVVARAELTNQSLQNVRVIFRQEPKTEGDKHYGSRLVFASDGNLFITLGERFDEMDEAQNPQNHLGAVVRIKPDGTIPEDNPFANGKNGKPEIWSYGHRNSQGAAIHPQTGKLWMHEHGPRGGDEINIPEAGKNYGWPEASYGIHYWMVPIKDEHAEQGFEEPIYHWTPSVAPSGMMFYSGDLFPEWKGDLFVGTMVDRDLRRIELDGTKVVRETRLLEERDARIRDVAQDARGAIYVVTDEEEGVLLKLGPKF